MTKDEYLQARDLFTEALRVLREVEIEFIETAYTYASPDETESMTIPELLDEKGLWLTDNEWYAVEWAIEVLERLVGRAHERSGA